MGYIDVGDGYWKETSVGDKFDNGDHHCKRIEIDDKCCRQLNDKTDVDDKI